MSRYEGGLVATGLRFALVAARFNDFIVDRLLGGATDALLRHGTHTDDVDVVRVPGSWEIPLACKVAAESGRYDAVVALGCVIRGGTPHFDYVAGEVAKGVAHVGLATGVPVTFGVLTCDTLEQAVDRAGAKSGNKGFDAAMAAIEMAGVVKALRGKKG
ncbi:MAG TPA: 6,7-dimethyl-8-ribityllumazine synthase [Myxococcota bacterium]|jgi:6,7-dimethyl-8-ribityllumazine synthase|nr:6,7-dimethyl-8-ribityllumazine synthase [Myxococcota bacterium]